MSRQQQTATGRAERAEFAEDDDIAFVQNDPLPMSALNGGAVSDDESDEGGPELRYTKFMITGIPGEKEAILIPDNIPLNRALLEEICDVIDREPPNMILGGAGSLCHPANLTTPQLRGCGAFAELLAEAKHDWDPDAEASQKLMQHQDRNTSSAEDKSLEEFANRVLERKALGMVGSIADAAVQANSWIFSGPIVSTFEVLLQEKRQNGESQAVCAVSAHAQDLAYMESVPLARDLMHAIFEASCELSTQEVENFEPIALSGELWNPARNCGNPEFHKHGYDYWSFDSADIADAQGHPLLQWPWPHADIFFLFYRQCSQSMARGKVDWQFRTKRRFDSVPVELAEIAPLGQIFIGGQAKSKWKLMHQLQRARPTVILDNTPDVSKQFAILMDVVKKALAGNRKRVAPFLLDDNGLGATCTAKQLLQALSPGKLLEHVQEEFDSSGMEANAALTLNDVSGILYMAQQRMRSFKQNIIVLDPLTASSNAVTNQLSAVFCGIKPDAPTGGASAAARSARALLLQAWQKHACLVRSAAQTHFLASALDVAIFLASFGSIVLAVSVMATRLKHDNITMDVLRRDMTEEDIEEITRSFPYTRISGVLHFWVLILPIVAGLVLTLRSYFQFWQKWSTLSMAAQKVVSEVYLFLGGSAPTYSKGGEEALKAFASKLTDIEVFLASAEIDEQDLEEDEEAEVFKDDPKALQRHIEENVYHIQQGGLISLVLKWLCCEGLDEDDRRVRLGEFSLEPTGPLQAEEFIQLRVTPLLRCYSALSKSTSSLRARLQIGCFLLLGCCTWLSVMDMPMWTPIFFGGSAILGVLIQFMAPAETVAALNEGIAALKHLDLQWNGCSAREQRSEKMQQHVIRKTESISIAVATALARAPCLPVTDFPAQEPDTKLPFYIGGKAISFSRMGSRAGSRASSRAVSRPASPHSSLGSSPAGTPTKRGSPWGAGSSKA